MDVIAYQPAHALAAAIASRKLGSRELLEHLLQRVERLNPGLNAVVTLDTTRARARADEADAASARGESWGPLHGLPMTVKDSLETAGLRTTSGAPALAEHVPVLDAPAVARLKAAGAIVYGKTNLPTMAMDVQSFNPLFGTSNNPWDPARSPGGSSGGSAAALAAGFTPLELGSDIGGSIRNPAHYCGVYGHKPSHGIVPGRGHIPGPPGTRSETDIAVIGPLARCAEDLGLALDIIAGPDADRATAWRLQLPLPRATRITQFRVAAWLDDPACAVDADVSAVLQRVVQALRQGGVRVDEQARPALGFDDALRVFRQLLFAATSSDVPAAEFNGLAAWATTLDPTDTGAAAAYAAGTTLRHRDWLRLNETRQRQRVAWAHFFDQFDVLLCPVSPVAAILHDHSEPEDARRLTINGVSRSYWDQVSWAGLPGGVLLPCTVAPVGLTKAGLPVGVQIVGPFLEDKTTIGFAAQLSRLIGGFQVPPGC